MRAFDKHFNLLLTDVDETYSPRIVSWNEIVDMAYIFFVAFHLGA